MGVLGKLWKYDCSYNDDWNVHLSLSLSLSPSHPGILRWSVICSFLSASLEGVNGNMKGDGTLLGSSLVVGPGDQGILFQHRSREFGDRANVKDILKAIKNIKSS